MYMAASLPLFLKPGTLQRSYYILAVDSREFPIHALTGTAKRMIIIGSGSVGIASPSCCILAT